MDLTRFSARLALFGPLVLGAMLTGCGQRGELKPAKGAALPVAPYGSAVRPSAARLLQTPTVAIPERNVELRTKSETRADDPFDLPPPEKPDPSASATPQPDATPEPEATETPTAGAQGD